MTTDSSPKVEMTPAHFSARHWYRYLGWGALAFSLVLGFWAYTTPEMRLHWDSVVSMCGF